MGFFSKFKKRSQSKSLIKSIERGELTVEDLAVELEVKTKQYEQLVQHIQFIENTARELAFFSDKHEMYKFIVDEINSSEGYNGMLLFLTSDGKRIGPYSGMPMDHLERELKEDGHDAKVIRHTELKKMPAYQQVINTKETFFAGNIRLMMEQAMPKLLAYTIAKLEGIPKDANCILAPVQDLQGEVIGIIALSSPILNEYFIPTVAEFGRHISRSIERISNEKNRKIEEQQASKRKQDAIKSLAGGVAHDFNNLLGSILGNAQMLLEENRTSDRDMLDDIIEASTRGADLSNQLLDYAKGGKFKNSPQYVSDVIKDSLDTYGVTSSPDVKVVVEADSLWPVEMDRSQLCDRVFMNLFVNADYAMENGGTLTVRGSNVKLTREELPRESCEPGKYVKINVEDTGVGMSKEVMVNIFNPFFTTREMNRGTGLGLATAKGIVENHNGFINVNSCPDEGTTFEIFLPATDKKVKRSSMPTNVLAEESKKILVVDDERLIRVATQRMLKILNYDCILAADGAAAVSIYKEKRDEIGFVILDMVMPKMNGLETYRNLKSFDPDVKAIAMSGYSRDANIESMLNEGCLDFVQKPVNKGLLSQVCAKTLNR